MKQPWMCYHCKNLISYWKWISYQITLWCQIKILKFLKLIFQVKEYKFYADKWIFLMIITYMKACKFVSKWYQCFLSQIRYTHKEVKELKDICIVKKYSEFFLDDLPRLPPERERNFIIDLLPSSKPVANAPYRR